MNSQTEWKRATDVTSVTIGDQIVSASGVEIIVQAVRVEGLHLTRQTVLIEYSYDDNGHCGIEKVSAGNFYNNINS